MGKWHMTFNEKGNENHDMNDDKTEINNEDVIAFFGIDIFEHGKARERMTLSIGFFVLSTAVRESCLLSLSR